MGEMGWAGIKLKGKMNLCTHKKIISKRTRGETIMSVMKQRKIVIGKRKGEIFSTVALRAHGCRIGTTDPAPRSR